MDLLETQIAHYAKGSTPNQKARAHILRMLQHIEAVHTKIEKITKTKEDLEGFLDKCIQSTTKPKLLREIADISVEVDESRALLAEAKSLRDIMHAYGEATKLLQDYVDGCGTEEYPSDWKHLCMDLATLINGPDSPFSHDAYAGLHWMNMIVFNRLCDTCNDNKAFEWMKAFAKAWVAGETLPKFSEIGCTCCVASR